MQGVIAKPAIFASSASTGPCTLPLLKSYKLFMPYTYYVETNGYVSSHHITYYFATFLKLQTSILGVIQVNK